MDTSTLKVLMLEDSPTDAEIIQRLLSREPKKFEFRLTMTKKDFLRALEDFSPDVILSDNSLPQLNSAEALEITRQKFIHVPFILVTGTVSEEYAAHIIREGADDYILKDRMTRLPSAIDLALRRRKAIKELIDYKYALDQSAIVAMTDAQGVIIYANENFCKTSEYAITEILGQTHKIVNSGLHEDVFFKELWNTITSGGLWKGEICNKNESGKLYWVDTTIIPFMDGNGRPYQYLSIGIDITRRKLAEQELEKSNQRFRYATEASSDIIWELNFETKEFLVHEGKQKLFGVEKELNWDTGVKGEYIVPGQVEYVRESFRRCRYDMACDLWQEEYKVRSVEEEEFDIANHAIFIRDENGKALRAIGAISDITEKRKLENELLEQRTREQLKVTATALEAQEKERNLIAQELHDNVNQILVGTKLLLSGLNTVDRNQRELLADCMENLQKAISENRKISHHLVTPDMENLKLADQVVDVTDTMLRSGNITVKLDTRNLQEERLSNPQKLAIYRIIQEQCTNIVKYADATQVDLIMGTNFDRFIMYIRDNGVGADPADITGGIGLNNIKARLLVLNGSSAIHTEKGGGFMLTVELPLPEEE